jgi:hypothetical protein
MKKLTIAIVFVATSLVSVVPNKAQSNDMDNLQKQVTILKNNNSRLEGRLKHFMKTSEGIKDSLQTGLNQMDTKLKVLSDSLATKEAQIKVLKIDAETSKGDIHSLAVSNTIQYIFFVLALILILAVYFMSVKKVAKVEEEIQERLTKATDEIGQKVSKTSDMLKSELVETKDELQRKISDVEKKLSAKVKEAKE